MSESQRVTPRVNTQRVRKPLTGLGMGFAPVQKSAKEGTKSGVLEGFSGWVVEVTTKDTIYGRVKSRVVTDLYRAGLWKSGEEVKAST